MEDISLLFSQLLPILGAIVLLILAVVLFRVIKILSELLITVQKVNVTVEDVNNKLVDLDVPVKTVKNISGSVDSGFKAGGKAVSNVVGRAKGTVSSLRSLFKGKKQ